MKKKIKIFSIFSLGAIFLYPIYGHCNEDELNSYRVLVQFKEKKPQEPTKIYTFYEEPANKGKENKPEDYQYSFFKNEGFDVEPKIKITNVFQDDDLLKYHYQIEFTENKTLNTSYNNTPNQYHENQEKSIFVGDTTQKIDTKTGEGDTTLLNFENNTKNQSKILYTIAIRIDKNP